MKTFIIDPDNNITQFASQQEASSTDEAAKSFTTQAGLEKIAEEWPMNRFIEIWNGLTGVTPVKKFTNHKTAVGRIWKAIQNLETAVPEGLEEAQPTRDVGPGGAVEREPSHKPTAPKAAKRGAPRAREGSKKETILQMIRREEGATLEELVNATGSRYGLALIRPPTADCGSTQRRLQARSRLQQQKKTKNTTVKG